MSAKFNGGAYSGSGSASFARSVNLDTSALNIVASVFADKGGQYLVPHLIKTDGQAAGVNFGEISIAPAALKFLEDTKLPVEDRLRAFFSLCGDSVVATVRHGGRLDALLKLKAYSREEKQKLAIELSAKGPMASGGASMNKELEKKVSNNQFEFEYLQAGGSPDKTPIDPQTLLSKLSTFAATEGFIPKPYEIYTLSYKSLRNWPAGLTFTSPQELDLWANHYWRLMGLVAELSAAALNSNEYVYHAHTSRDNVFEQHDFILAVAAFIDATLNVCVQKRSCDLSDALSGVISDIAAGRGIRTSSQSAFRASQKGLADLLEASYGIRALAQISDSKEITQTLGMPFAAAASAFKDDKNTFSVLRNDPAPPGASEPAKKVIEEYNWNGFDWYYYWQAAKPIRRGMQEVAPEINVKALIDANQAKAANALELAEQKLKEMLLTQRLLPLSASFCAVSATHPMCLSIKRMKDIVGAVPFTLSLAAVTPDNIAPPPPPPPSPPPKREPRRLPDCNPRLCN